MTVSATPLEARRLVAVLHDGEPVFGAVVVRTSDPRMARQLRPGAPVPEGYRYITAEERNSEVAIGAAGARFTAHEIGRPHFRGVFVADIARPGVETLTPGRDVTASARGQVVFATVERVFHGADAVVFSLRRGA